MLYMFTYENQRHYAVLKALGASARTLIGDGSSCKPRCVRWWAPGAGLGVCGIRRRDGHQNWDSRSA